jgi:alkylation response protein AidB-like acyl-CoA dehydrogenase
VDFSFSEHQLVWGEKAARFTDEEVRPLWRDIELSRGALGAVCKKASDRGLFDICLTNGEGKESSDLLTGALVIEELSKGDCGFAVIFVNSYLSSRAAQLSVSHDFRNDLLGRITNSQEGTGIAFLWPRITANNSVVENIKREETSPTGADTPMSDSLSYAHSSVECFVGFGRVAPLDQPPGLHLVLAERDKVKILEERQGAFSRDSLRLYRLHLGEARDLKVVRLEDGDHHRKLIDTLLAERAILFCAVALGVAGAAFEYALAYSGERIAFGRPIIQHQAINLKLADIYIDLEAARLLLWEAAYKQAEGAGDARQLHEAMNYCYGVALGIASNAMQVLGGHGYLRDHPSEKWMREIQFLRLLR